MLQDRMEAECRGAASIPMLERKIGEMQDNEARLTFELETVKGERDKKLMEHQDILERERDTYKRRISELETKSKESEYAKSTQMFEFEKEKAKWTIDRDRLMNSINDLKEKYEKMELEKQKIHKDLEKFRKVKQTA
jgi:chromosome segregation ATPase